MFKYFNFLFFVSCSIVGLDVARANNIHIQLLIEDENLEYVQSLTKANRLDYPNRIAHPHVSFLKINDGQGIIQKNFEQFANGLNAMLEQEGPFKFMGQNVKGYESEKTGVTYWCIEDADKTQTTTLPNAKLKSIGEKAKRFVADFVNARKGPKPFIPMDPDQLVEDLKVETTKIEQSYAEYSKGFPHVSIAKGKELPEYIFSNAKNQQIIMNIKGFNAVYTYSENPEVQLPQIYISKYFGDTRYELDAKFDSLKKYNNLYPDIHSLLQSIGGLDSENIQHEITQKSKSVRVKRNAAEAVLDDPSSKRIKSEEKSAPMNANPLVNGSVVQEHNKTKQEELETLKKKIEILELRKKLEIEIFEKRKNLFSLQSRMLKS